MTITPDFDSFAAHFKNGKSQVVMRVVPSDMDTPVSTYLKLAAEKPYSFLLESVEGGDTLGRYSIIGLDPDIIWECEGQKAQTIKDGKIIDTSDNPLESLRALLKDCAIDIAPEKAPPMAVSGLFGMMGYDMIRLIEKIPDTNPDSLNIPDGVMMRPTVLLMFDNVQNKLFIAIPIYETTGDSKAFYDDAVQKIDCILNDLETASPKTKHASALKDINLQSNTDEKTYHAMVDQAVEYIHAGEIFQVVPSQRFSFDFDIPAFELYRALRRLNPSPFLFYFNFKGFHLVGSSPEILVRVRDNTVTIRPIAGTRKRGKDEAEDKALSEDLLNDPKERAEHLMLLDLGRNDIGRVADIGTVDVTDQFTIEYYSHVMHIVSNVEGKLKDTFDTIDALFAGFPAGTVSGAPKIRAMEIIDELETVKRKFYAGCVGYLSGNGSMDTCIALRTALVKDGKAYVQAGGGVVADSKPDFEYQETVNKAGAVIQAAKDALGL